MSAAESGDNYPCALNAAGEIAVRAFLDGKISFPAIGRVIGETLSRTERMSADSYEALAETDARAREQAKTLLCAPN